MGWMPTTMSDVNQQQDGAPQPEPAPAAQAPDGPPAEPEAAPVSPAAAPPASESEPEPSAAAPAAPTDEPAAHNSPSAPTASESEPYSLDAPLAPAAEGEEPQEDAAQISYNPALTYNNGSPAGAYPHMTEHALPPPPAQQQQHPAYGPPQGYAGGYGPPHSHHDHHPPPPQHHHHQQQQHQQQQRGRGRDRGPPPGDQFKIFIAGLPTHTEEADLMDCFAEVGNVAGVDLKKGYGFVRFNDLQSAQAAVAKYDQGSFLGNTIKVEMSHNQGPRASKITCFNCGAEGHYARACPLPEDLEGQRQRAQHVAQRTRDRQAAKNGERLPHGAGPPMDMAAPMAGMPPMPPADPYGAPPYDRGAPYYAGGRDYYADRMGGGGGGAAPPPAQPPYPPPYLRDSDPVRPVSSAAPAPYDYRAGQPGGYGYSPPPADRYGGMPPYARDYYPPPPPVDPYYRGGYDYAPPPMGYNGYGADPYYGAPPRGRTPPPITGAAPITDDRRGSGYAPVPGGAARTGRRRSMSPQARAAGYSDNASRRVDRF